MRAFRAQAEEDASKGLQFGKDRLRIVEALVFVRNNPDQVVEEFMLDYFGEEDWIDATDEAVMKLEGRYPVYWDQVKNKFLCVPFFKDDSFLFSINNTGGSRTKLEGASKL